MRRFKSLLLVGLATILTGLNITNVQAAVSNDTVGQEDNNTIDNGLGGMSAILNNYYDTIFSESGISVNNVTTTLSIDGEPIQKVNRVSAQFLNLAFADVIDYVNIRKEPSTDVRHTRNL